jgi:nicotinate-nucleotide adenylyltransferase
MKKHIALLGGSFDPPHSAHVQIAEHLLKSKKYDEIWVIPAERHPWKPTEADFEDRWQMCRLAFAPLGPRVRILEDDRGASGYTVDLVRRLHQAHPDRRFTFVGGTDLKKEFAKWKDPEVLHEFLVFEFLPRPPERSPFPDISSTEIRRRVKNRLPIGELVPKAVEEYISRKKLYA